MRSEEYCNMPALLPKSAYNNDLRDEPCPEKEYEQIKDLTLYFPDA